MNTPTDNNDVSNHKLERILEMIPGIALWILLLSPLWAGVSFPMFILNVFLILSVYWLYRALLTPIGLFFGYRKVQDALKKDWMQEIKNLRKEDLPNSEELPDDLFPGYLVVLPNYGEEYPVLQRTIKALMEQNYPKEKIYLCVSIEQRKALKDPVYANRLNLLKEEFGDFFKDRLFLTAHPGDIPGEVPGAASGDEYPLHSGRLHHEFSGKVGHREDRQCLPRGLDARREEQSLVRITELQQHTGRNGSCNTYTIRRSKDTSCGARRLST
jgi:hypothetical protein